MNYSRNNSNKSTYKFYICMSMRAYCYCIILPVRGGSFFLLFYYLWLFLRGMCDHVFRKSMSVIFWCLIAHCTGCHVQFWTLNITWVQRSLCCPSISWGPIWTLNIYLSYTLQLQCSIELGCNYANESHKHVLVATFNRQQPFPECFVKGKRRIYTLDWSVASRYTIFFYKTIRSRLDLFI